MGLLVLLLIGRAMTILYLDGYLPQPFFYEPSDTFMDWFNTAYWARDPGSYDSWKTIYPPLSFVVLRYLGKGSCYAGAEGLPVRDCDWIGLVVIHAIFLLNIVLTAWTFLKVDRRTALPRAIALSSGLPMLYALERGNILLLCFTAVLLGFGPLLKSARLRWLFAGIAVNFKIYLIAGIGAQLLRRRWLWFEGALLATLLVYLLSYGLLGAGTPTEIFTNIRDYSSGFIASQVLDIWYAVTYQPLTSLLQGESFPITNVIGSQVAETGLLIIPLIVRLGQASILIAAVATWLRPEVVPPYRVAFLGIAMALISSEAGGYTQMMMILFVFMEPWRGIARPIAILTCYILCLPGDIIIGDVPSLLRDSFLSGRPVEVQFGVGLGMFVRPGLLILVCVSLSAATVHDVWADIRHQGWKHRWRFRRDWPMLPGILRPREPARGQRQPS
ncbi:hypothetical protein [Sphingobium sp. CAP-1]|uniref:hypothetical protein n=1 Tax=Sphingobium sp. CAP-1 TaxID=2676077 RepID=UPI0012BB36E6|nr:hypothetical protein [Sphingobium sp. CAP-1]QGP79716.1 hypothetical protein GL174_12575 [Sphingobium sp. CAP-1]